jgi:hypothetical protein
MPDFRPGMMVATPKERKTGSRRDAEAAERERTSCFEMLPRCFQWNGGSYFHPGGMPAISRGWREARALPPDTQRKYPDPGPGSQAFHSREAMSSGLASLQDAISSSLAFRWYRCARPPANRSEPFRFWGDHLHHAIMASRARVWRA